VQRVLLDHNATSSGAKGEADMKKRIIVCCDGTWNEPESVKDKVKVPTNVLKMVRAIAAHDKKNNINQVIYYDQGVGTGSLGVIDRHIGGGTGFGISKNIRDCYSFIANNYSEGDEIYLFGFSRGAYTIRSLGGMLGTVGLLSKNDLRYVPEAYAYYHTVPKKREKSPHCELIVSLLGKEPKATPIKLIGVWDTVGALGIPTPILGRVQRWAGKIWKRFRVGFHNCTLDEHVENAYHALAIDERRGPFKPSIWNEFTKQRNVLQVWFAGVHSNIGGGYEDSGLSDTAFVWMADRARECGLVINEDYMKERVDANESGKLEDSYSFGYKLLERLRVKPYDRMLGQKEFIGEMIHESVAKRIQDQQLEPSYQPKNVLGEDEQLNIITEDDMQYVQIESTRIPVFRERKCYRAHSRELVGEASATVTINGQQSQPCKIIDFNHVDGARLQVVGSVNAGDKFQLDSEVLGNCSGVVVWQHDKEIGVHYAA